MASSVRTPEMAAAFDAVSGGLQRLRAVGVAPVDGADARVVMGELEVLGRRVAALQVAVLGDVQRRGLHRHDGMVSAKVMMRHCCKLSDEQARRWEMIRRALADLPLVEAAYGAGRIGTGQVALIARAHGNVRVRDALVAEDEALVRLAERLSYLELACCLRNWERMVDADGTADKAARGHEQRDATCVQDLKGNWEGRWRCGPLEGARRRAILRAFMAAEFDADWAKARAALGDAATVADLARTEAQRRSDALDEIFRSAADHHAAAPGGSPITTTVVMDRRSFEAELARLAGAEPDLPVDTRLDPDGEPDQPGRGDRSGWPGPQVGFRSSTLDGHPVDPRSAVAAALCEQVRRAVVGAGSVVIDLGRRQRLFTGPAALALRLPLTTCAWPGCHVPVTDCQGDHLRAWHRGGSTSPGNGAPLCGRHNRTKEQGYRMVRDQLGDLHVHRPDGTEIT